MARKPVLLRYGASSIPKATARVKPLSAGKSRAIHVLTSGGPFLDCLGPTRARIRPQGERSRGSGTRAH